VKGTLAFVIRARDVSFTQVSAEMLNC
jgi:hypothetical protein